MSRQILPNPVVWSHHQANWNHCQSCDLCEARTKVCLFRYLTTNTASQLNPNKVRTFPTPSNRPSCDILAIGEAPGESEDVKGMPFSGPSGKLLDAMVRDAYQIHHKTHSITRSPIFGLTNIVACYPTEDEQGRAPNKREIEACRPRLLELIASAHPTWIICLGNVAKAAFPGSFNSAISNIPGLAGISHIKHPSVLVRIDNPTKRGTEYALYRTELVSILSQWAEASVLHEVQRRPSRSPVGAR